jgi:hypothetical protein
MSNKEELEKLITLLEPYSKDNQAIQEIINTNEIRIMKANVSDEEKDKIYADVTKVLSDSEIKTILDEFSKIKDEKIKGDKIKILDKNIEILQKRKDGETDENKLKEIDSLLDIANFKKNVILKIPDPAVKPASVVASSTVAASTVAANPAASLASSASVAAAAAKPAASSAAVVVYVKIGADNSIEIMDNIPPSATLSKSSFYDIIKNDITSDTYIAMDITETCSIMDDSCIQYNGTDYSMDLQNMGASNQPLDMNFLKVKASATNASATNASATNASATNASSSAEEGEVEGEVEEVEEEKEEKVEEGEEEEEEKVEGEEEEEGHENKSLEEEIKKDIPEKEEINKAWKEFVDSVIGKIELSEDEKKTILKDLLKIKNDQIIGHISDPYILKNIEKYKEEINKDDKLRTITNINEYLENVDIYSLEHVDGGMSMNIFH